MMSRAAVHEHRVTKSQQRMRRDLIEIAAMIDEARDSREAARAILDAGYRRESEGHADALRIVGKEILKDLWIAARDLHLADGQSLAA